MSIENKIIERFCCFQGETNRAIGQHVLNKVSSRSHCIFQFRIECKSISASNERYVVSKLNLVDLAGSERLAKTQVTMSFKINCNLFLRVTRAVIF